MNFASCVVVVKRLPNNGSLIQINWISVSKGFLSLSRKKERNANDLTLNLLLSDS